MLYSLPVLVGVGGVYALWQWNSLKLLFMATTVLTTYCWIQKRKWKKYDDKSLTYFFFDKCVEFFVPLAIVLVFYTVLALAIEGTAERGTLSIIEKLENGLDKVYGYVAWLKLKPWVAVLYILGIISIDLLLSLFLKYKDLASWYKPYSLWSKRVYTVVVLLCSFSFFGNVVGEKRAHLRTRTDKIRDGYARIQEEAENLLSDSVQQKLYEKIQTSFPSEIEIKLDYLKSISEKLDDLRVSRKFAEAMGIHDKNVAKIIEYYETIEKQDPGFSEKPIRYTETEPVSQQKPTHPPAEATSSSVEKSLAEIKQSTRHRFVSLIKRDGTKELFCQFPKSFTNVTKSAVFKAAIEKYPLLEPIVDVFVGTFDKAIEERVKAATDKVAAAMLKNPNTVNHLVVEEVEAIVNSVTVKDSPAALEKIQRIAADIDRKFKEIDAAIENLKNQMNHAAKAQASLFGNGSKSSENDAETRDWFTCHCSGRVIWGPTLLTKSEAQARCPRVPCR